MIIIFIDTAFPECVVAYKKVNGSIEVVTVLSDNNFQTYDYSEEYRYITHKDDEFYIVRERQRKYCVNENKESDFVSIEEKRDYYYEWDIEICNLTESMLKQKYIIEEYLRCVEYFENDKLIVKKVSREGYDLLTTTPPALVTVLKSNVPPRCATLKTKMAARKKEIIILTESEMETIELGRCGIKGSPTRVKTTYVPVQKQEGYIIREKEVQKAVEELIEKLQKDEVLRR